eukprot:TRINITY_DN4348_c0_g1_i16.p2 TRINITY_DN4348_c0_g1~~TRINITY_DN4348_c0_g1_i16.p2  ORF type:complete len:116 (-),score=34.45 TRINITY_DN4348_c0_g1_i16:54-401(-)
MKKKAVSTIVLHSITTISITNTTITITITTITTISISNTTIGITNTTTITTISITNTTTITRLKIILFQNPILVMIKIEKNFTKRFDLVRTKGNTFRGVCQLHQTVLKSRKSFLG